MKLDNDSSMIIVFVVGLISILIILIVHIKGDSQLATYLTIGFWGIMGFFLFIITIHFWGGIFGDIFKCGVDITENIAKNITEAIPEEELKESKKTFFASVLEEITHDKVISNKKNKIEKLEFELKEAELLGNLGRIKAEPPQRPRSKTQVEKINERARLEKTIKETITKNRKRDLFEIDERAKREGLDSNEVQIQKEITIAHWAKIEMEQLQKLESKFG